MNKNEKPENLQWNMEFKFTPKEIKSIDSIVKNKKFETKRQLEIVYPENDVQKIKYFINSLRLFQHLNYYYANIKDGENSETNKQITDKINIILMEYSYLYSIAQDLYLRYLKNSNFAKHRIKNKISQFLIDYKLQINNLMDFVYQSGQHIIQVNPSEISGYN